MRRVLVCAATRSERDACERGIAGAPRPPTSDHELLLTGVGPVHAARALAARLERGSLPDLIVSSGFAGSLTPALEIASWITAVRLREWDGDARFMRVDPFPDLVACELVSSGALRSGVLPCAGAAPIAADMESLALAREAARLDVAFSVVRLVSDSPAHPLPAFLSPFTAALAATTSRARVMNALRGARGALADPRAVVRLVADGRSWLHRLEEGWRTFACLRT